MVDFYRNTPPQQEPAQPPEVLPDGLNLLKVQTKEQAMINMVNMLARVKTPLGFLAFTPPLTVDEWQRIFTAACWIRRMSQTVEAPAKPGETFQPGQPLYYDSQTGDVTKYSSPPVMAEKCPHCGSEVFDLFYDTNHPIWDVVSSCPRCFCHFDALKNGDQGRSKNGL